MDRFIAALGQLDPSEWIALGAVVVAAIGACISVFAARIEVQDNIDRFIADLARQSKWTGISAAVNIVAAALVFVAAALQIIEKVHG